LSIQKCASGAIKLRKFPVLPEGISNSSRYPVFPDVVDTVFDDEQILTFPAYSTAVDF